MVKNGQKKINLSNDGNRRPPPPQGTNSGLDPQKNVIFGICKNSTLFYRFLSTLYLPEVASIHTRSRSYVGATFYGCSSHYTRKTQLQNKKSDLKSKSILEISGFLENLSAILCHDVIP